MKWVQKINSRLAALYGKQFSAMWENADLDEVEHVWAEELGGFNATQIGGALKACSAKAFAPNLPEFIALCRQVILPAKIAIEHKMSDEQIQENKIKIEEVAKNLTPKTDHLRCAKRILERHKNKDKTLSLIQINFSKEAMKNYRVYENE